MAVGLHGGLLFAFADQIGATTITKTKTEISILDLPSVSGTTKLEAKPLKRIQPNLDARLKPNNAISAKRLENAPQKTATISATNAAKPAQKTSKIPVATVANNANSIQAAPRPKSIRPKTPSPSRITTRIKDRHETSKSVPSQRIDIAKNNLKPTQSIAKIKSIQTAKLVQPGDIKHKKTTDIKLEIGTSALSGNPLKKIPPADVKKSIKTNSFKAVIIAKTLKKTLTIATTRIQKTAIPRFSNKITNSSKPIKPFTKKPTTPERIGRIKTVKSPSKVSRQPHYNPSTKVAILARPRQITPPTQPKPTNEQADSFAKVVNFLKFHTPENTCFLALPTISDQEKMVLSGFSNEKSSWPRFQKALAQSTNFKIAGRLASISDAQCQVMTFARQSPSYPSYSVSLQLDYSSIKNGEFIAGKLFIDEGRYLNLLLIDDEGTAININRFVDIGKNTSSFQLQVNLTGGKVSTSQLLLAIVTDRLLDSMSSHAPIPVSKLLRNIKIEIEARDIHMDLALTAFEVR